LSPQTRISLLLLLLLLGLVGMMWLLARPGLVFLIIPLLLLLLHVLTLPSLLVVKLSCRRRVWVKSRRGRQRMAQRRRGSELRRTVCLLRMLGRKARSIHRARLPTQERLLLLLLLLRWRWWRRWLGMM